MTGVPGPTGPIDEDAARRAIAVVTCIVQGSMSGARQLIEEDEDTEALALAMAQQWYGLVHVQARERHMAPAAYWAGYALHHEVALQWWRDNGPTL